jgi:hypothetical protein
MCHPNWHPKTNIAFHKQHDFFGNNSIGPLSINVGPSLPFHPLYFLFSHSSQVIPKMQKISKSIRELVFAKMKGMSKEEVERLSQLRKERQKGFVD